MQENIVGVDIGTMNIVSQFKVDSKSISINKIRNMFLLLDYNVIEFSDLQEQQIEYVKLDDVNNKVVVLGEDQYKLANIFNMEVRRTMKRGIIQQNEIDQLDVIAIMMKKLLPNNIDSKQDKGKCVYSIPSNPIDQVDVPDTFYHEQIFKKVFNTIGYDQESLNEQMQLIFSNCKAENYSGIQISFGQGLTNICCAYKGTPTIQFSIYRGGDWIDHNQQKSIGQLESRVTFVKEKSFDLLELKQASKQEKRIKEQLQFFYENLIQYTIGKIIEKISLDQENLSIDSPIPIVISGGTSLPNGFLETFKRLFEENGSDFPYEISEIRRQKDPLNDVQEGCLLYQMWKAKKGE